MAQYAPIDFHQFDLGPLRLSHHPHSHPTFPLPSYFSVTQVDSIAASSFEFWLIDPQPYFKDFNHIDICDRSPVLHTYSRVGGNYALSQDP